MKRKQLLLLSLTLLLLVPTSAGAQQWSGIIDPSRAVDWSGVGVYGGIPTGRATCVTSACNILAGGTVNSTSIANAIASAPANTVVVLPAGTFAGLGGISLNVNNITLRGQGADQTKLIFSSYTPCSSGADSAAICVSGSFNWSGGLQNQAAWTAGFAKGTTVLTLSNTTNLSVGGMIILSQNKDTAGYPTANDILVCDVSTLCSTEGASPLGLGGQTAFYRVQAVSGNQVTIYPPLEAPNWRLSQLPLAWWPTTARSGVGIENLSVDSSASCGCVHESVAFSNAIGNWVTGVRSVIAARTGEAGYHIKPYLSAQTVVRNNYLYGYRDTAAVNYGIWWGAGWLVENNIVEQHVVPFADSGPGSNGSVIAYNYSTNGVGINGIPGWTFGIFYHNISDFMNLIEGNDTQVIYLDAIHGSHNFSTIFRNYVHGQVNQTANSELISIRTRARNMNVVGNVLGCGTAATCPGSTFPYYVTYESVQGDSDKGVYGLGGPYTGSGHTAPSDSQVALDIMRWGNYDTVNNAVRFVGGEVPSALANFANPVPSSQTLPASFYLATRPSWWSTSIPYPAAGPDVSGGNIVGIAGHANKIPARVCYDGLSADPAYAGTNPPVKTFSANTCYAPSGPPPGPPFIVSAVVN